MKNSVRNLFFVAVVLFSAAACTELELDPKSQTNGAIVFEDESSYRSFIARVYSGLAVTGQQGPAGQGDIQDIDEGFSNYWRQYWGAQQFPTDEAVIGWGDEGLPDFHDQDWTEANQFVTALYNRVFFQVSLSNEFLRETTDAKLTERGVSDELKATIQTFRAEARFLRALSYWHGLDLFGSIPFFTENDDIGVVAPDQAPKEQIFNFIESELKEIESQLPDAGAGQYGRADKGAAWALLAKLYLNATVYTGQDKNAECITYCNQLISSNAYELDDQFEHLFQADNHTSPEIIFPIAFDGLRTQTWGGMTFLTHAPVGGSMDPGSYGIDGGWWGVRTTSAFVDQFPDETGDIDARGMFYTDGQTKEIASISEFTNGYAYPKFVNVTSDGQQGANATFPDTDFPMFRLADVYLTYAEAVVRGGSGGNRATALGYVNAIRDRAYGNTDGRITDGDLNLDFLIDERSRELAWEAHRRTDLIRFGQLTDQGIWPWKGGVAEGKLTESFRNLYPIPSSELLANPKLDQNTGY